MVRNQIWTARICGIAEAVEKVKASLSQEGIENRTKIMAMYAIGTLGSRKDLACVEPYLKDASSWGSFNIIPKVAGGPSETKECEVRDIALGTAIMLTGQRLETYALSFQDSSGARYYYFNKPQDREAAFAKWNAWVKENPAEKAAK